MQITPGDGILTEPHAVSACVASIREVVADGKVYDAVQELGIVYGHTELVASVFPRLHRTAKPRRFTRDDVRSAIAGGDDSKLNILVVSVSGNVRLVEVDGPSDPQNDPTIAVRAETSMPGNDYVGEQASKNTRFVDDSYRGLMQLWIEHLRTGELNLFDDCPPTKSESALIRQVEELTAAIH